MPPKAFALIALLLLAGCSHPMVVVDAPIHKEDVVVSGPGPLPPGTKPPPVIVPPRAREVPCP